jgi:hypothetical protein
MAAKATTVKRAKLEDDLASAQGITGSSGQFELLAYRYWQERGSPVGSPVVDWERAQKQLAVGKKRDLTASVA